MLEKPGGQVIETAVSVRTVGRAMANSKLMARRAYEIL